MEPLGDGEVECSDYTDGRRSPLQVASIWGWKPVWGRRDHAVYWIAVPVLVVGLLLVRFKALWFMEVFGWPRGLWAMAFMIVVPPLLAGAYAARAGWQARNFPRAVREFAPRSWERACRPLTGGGVSRREPRVSMRGFVWLGNPRLRDGASVSPEHGEER